MRLAKHSKIIRLFGFFILTIGLYIFFRQLSLNELKVLLYPVSLLVRESTFSSFEFIPDQGYFFPELNILLEASCAGTNFFVLSFFVFSFFMDDVLERKAQLRILIPLFAFVAAYALSIPINYLRIMLSIAAQNLADLILPVRPHYLIHEIVGYSVQIIALLSLLMLNQKLLKTKTTYA